MNSNIEIKSKEKADEIIATFEDTIPKIKEIFDNQNTLFSTLENQEIWKSDLQRQLCTDYSKIKGEYENIINALNTHKEFLKVNVFGAYFEMEEKLNETLEANSNSFDA